MTYLDIANFPPMTFAAVEAEWSRRCEYERALMLGPLDAQLSIVQHRIQSMMIAQNVLYPTELTAGTTTQLHAARS